MVANLLLVNEDDLRKIISQEIRKIEAGKTAYSTELNVWIDSKDVPNYLSISRRTWQNYRDKGLIPYSQIGRKIWVKRSDLDIFIQSGIIGNHCQTFNHSSHVCNV